MGSARIVPNILEVMTSHVSRRSTVQSERERKLAYLKKEFKWFSTRALIKSTRILKILIELGNFLFPFLTHQKPPTSGCNV